MWRNNSYYVAWDIKRDLDLLSVNQGMSLLRTSRRT